MGQVAEIRVVGNETNPAFLECLWAPRPQPWRVTTGPEARTSLALEFGFFVFGGRIAQTTNIRNALISCYIQLRPSASACPSLAIRQQD